MRPGSRSIRGRVLIIRDRQRLHLTSLRAASGCIRWDIFATFLLRLLSVVTLGGDTSIPAHDASKVQLHGLLVTLSRRLSCFFASIAAKTNVVVPMHPARP